MLGDYAEIGCNAVLNPGVVIGRHSNVYPTSSVRGTVPENSIYKTGGIIVPKE
jgi:acetyltransferase-like isoleucine patch superfamily enzyme